MITSLPLTPIQQSIIQAPFSTIHLSGPNDCGKTTVGTLRLLGLIERGASPDSILVLVPQRTLAKPYTDLLLSPSFPSGGQPTILTFGGLAKRMVELFFPLISKQAGFGKQKSLPAFLTLESAQFYMAKVVEPMLSEGHFDSVTVERSRLYAQIIDNLNKAASIGLPFSEIGARLSGAWVGAPAQLRVFEDTQLAATRFREYCLQNNLLDFSLQMEVFCTHIWKTYIGRQYLEATFQHLIWDNIEEDVAIAHDIIREWLPTLQSALLIRDTNGGYRSFLGADPVSALALGQSCTVQASMLESINLSAEIQALERTFQSAILRPKETQVSPHFHSVFTLRHYHLFPEMISGTMDEIENCIAKGVSPEEIVILAPYMHDALRFTLQHELDSRGIPNRSHRPSRSLRDEPVARAIITFAAFAFPDWNLPVRLSDFRLALMTTITHGDLIRADLLARTVFRPKSSTPTLSSFDVIADSDHRDRITYAIGDRFERLRGWLSDAAEDGMELDVFFSRIFGEVLSQPGYGFHNNTEAASICARLIESVRKFRLSTQTTETPPIGKQYLSLLSSGVLAAQSLPAWNNETPAVFLSPAYTFLMANKPAKIQFWLDAGSAGWWQRLDQPLTHPYVLSRQWDPGRQWTDKDEFETNQLSMARLVTGLIRRCTGHIYLSTVSLNEQGNQEVGALLLATQRILREVARMDADHV